MARKELFEHETKREFNFFIAMIPLIVMVGSMLYAIVVLETDPHLPLIIGTITAAIVALASGFKFDDLEEMMYKGIRLALPAVVIIMLVGLIIGSWIGGGVVATMIYYGLMIISPQYFLVTICLICGIVALAIGSSWSTMATIGVAGMGIGVSMGINPAMIAGAVISGAYFGDKMSPLSDTTNLASGLTNTDLFVHIKHMFYTTIPGLIVALIAFFFIGINVIGTNTSSPEDIEVMMTSMNENFVISPWLLLVPALVILCIILKIKAVPALVIGIFLGTICAIFVQGETLAASASFLMNGFVMETNNEMVNNLFTRGGLMEMMYTISMTIVAMTFAGVLEYTGMLRSIMQPPLVIPTLMTLPDARNRMTESGNDMACVIDEYGGFTGILTLEDLSEEVVGEITDEHDEELPVFFEAQSDDNWQMNGEVHIDEAERKIGYDLPRGDYETVSGMLIAHLGNLPAVNEVIKIELPDDPADLVEDEPVKRYIEATVLEIDKRVPTLVNLILLEEDSKEVGGEDHV